MPELFLVGSAAPRALVADRDPLARRVVVDVLRGAAIEVVGAACTGDEAVALARRHRPDIVVLGDADAVATMLGAVPGVAVVVLTTADDDEVALAALRAGAAGCLSKEIELDALPRALRGVCAGEAAISRRLAMTLVERLHAERSGSAGVRAVRSPLTNREWEVLDLLADGGRQADIADQLVLSPETVRSHVKNVYRKLEVNSRE